MKEKTLQNGGKALEDDGGGGVVALARSVCGSRLCEFDCED